MMKNRLLAVLLTFTAISCFATNPSFAKASEDRPSDAELLAHLKNVKTDIEKMQEKLAIGLKELPEEYGQENYFFLLNMINEIDQQLDHSLKNNFFGESILKNAVELICNDLKTMDDISNIMTANINLLLETNSLAFAILVESGIDLIFTENDVKKAALIKSIFIKHHKKYCKNNPDDDLVELQFKELCHPDTLWPFLLTSTVEWLYKLSEEIDTKIAELACPSACSL